MKVKAAVCYEFAKPLVIEEVAMESPRPGQVRVRVAAVGICGSDIHSIKGEHGPANLPAVPGHEVAGYVEEIGEGVTYVKPGDRVVCSLARAGCGQCYYCVTGRPFFCEHRGPIPFKLPGPYLTQKGDRLTQLAGQFAGFVECTNVPEECLVKISDDMPLDLAALLGCGVISGFGAVVNCAQVKPFESVVVIGAGGVGLNAIQGARFVGAHPIVAVDTSNTKLETAFTFGATHAVNAMDDPNPVETVRAITYGRGADFVFVTVAGVGPKRQGFLMSAPAGTTVFIGHGVNEALSAWDAVELVGGRVLTGSAMGQSRIRLDITRLVEIFKAGRLKLAELITGRYPLEQINEAIEATEKGEALRNVVVF